MVAIEQGRRRVHAKGKGQGKRRSKDGGDSRDSSEAASRRDETEGRPSRAAAKPRRVSAREAARRIRGLAAASDTLAGATRLRRLADLVRKDGRNARRMAFLETAIGEGLDELGQRPSPLERWTTCEASTWALAWMARTKRAGGSAGGLLERLVGQARAAQALLATGDTQPVRFVLVLAWLFADVEACRCLSAGAAATLEAEIERLVSPEGIPALTGSPAIVDRVVRWTAAREIARELGPPSWSNQSERRWRSAATTALRLLGERGRGLAAAGRMPESYTRDLLAGLRTSGGRRSRTAHAMLRGRPRRRLRGLLRRDVHDPGAGMAIIRTGWDRRSVRVLLDYRHTVPRLEIAVGDRLLVDGPWQWEVWADGRAVEPEAGWTVSCWESDRKATFVEITAPLGGGRSIERQVVVLPRDRVVLLADAITAPPSARAALRYRGTLPLASSLDVAAEQETREVVVSDVRPRLTVLPLALPEWRAEAAPGGLGGEPGSLVLSQEGANRLIAPLWLDCDPRRIGLPLTWRQLTIADSRIILPRHQAAGFRVQAGDEQWLLYRSLDTPRNRTLLGCNVSCEFLLGRIRNSGEVARTLEIQ